ncbi:MAG: SDR family oxidoreductase [Clostridium sp.]|nr:SDR family oxidoreductase [Clostridium sp.]
MLLKNKTAVITGCNRGIGKSILECFARNGANIYACVRKESEEFSKICSELMKLYEVNINIIPFDFTQDEEIKKAAKTIISSKCKIDILVNNASIVPENRLFSMMSMQSMKEIFDINFFSQMLFTQYISRTMMKQKCGSIVNMASIAALDGGPAQIEYVSSKAAIVGATKKLAAELGGYGIRVNAIAPGMTNTDMIKEMKEDVFQHSLNNVIMKRLAEPEEIANVALFLSSHMSSFVTGQVIRVDGGMLR